MSSPGSSLDAEGLKKYPCPQCSQMFTRQHNLKSHLLIHSQEKKFTCKTCSSKFRRIHDLKRHLKLHTGERPYLCQKCGRRFARGDALIRHTKASVTCSVAFVSLEASRVQDGELPPPTVEYSPLTPDVSAQTNEMVRRHSSGSPLPSHDEYTKQLSSTSFMNNRTSLPSILNSSTSTEEKSRNSGLLQTESLALPPISPQQHQQALQFNNGPSAMRTSSLYGTPHQDDAIASSGHYPQILKEYNDPEIEYSHEPGNNNNNSGLTKDVDMISQQQHTHVVSQSNNTSNLALYSHSQSHHQQQFFQHQHQHQHPHQSSGPPAMPYSIRSSISANSSDATLGSTSSSSMSSSSSSSHNSSSSTLSNYGSPPSQRSNSIPLGKLEGEDSRYMGHQQHHFQPHPQQQQQQVTSQPVVNGGGGSGGGSDPWRVIRVLESRVRALEERLNSAEGRVLFLEGHVSR